MYGDLHRPEICLPDSRRVAPFQARPHVDLSYLKEKIGKHSYKLRDVLTNVHDVTLCDFRRDMCCCNAIRKIYKPDLRRSQAWQPTSCQVQAQRFTLL